MNNRGHMWNRFYAETTVQDYFNRMGLNEEQAYAKTLEFGKDLKAENRDYFRKSLTSGPLSSRIFSLTLPIINPFINYYQFDLWLREPGPDTAKDFFNNVAGNIDAFLNPSRSDALSILSMAVRFGPTSRTADMGYRFEKMQYESARRAGRKDVSKPTPPKEVIPTFPTVNNRKQNKGHRHV